MDESAGPDLMSAGCFIGNLHDFLLRNRVPDRIGQLLFDFRVFLDERAKVSHSD